MATTATNSLEQQQQQQHQDQISKAAAKTVQSPSSQSNGTPKATSDGVCTIYDVEHLATFSTTGTQETNNGGPVLATESNVEDGDSFENNGCTSLDESTDKSSSNAIVTKTTPKIALQKLFELEKLSGIWTQRMQIELREDCMLIVDCESNSIVEKFNRDCVIKPEAFNQYNDIYNNIIVFMIQQQQQAQLSCDSKTNTNDNSNHHHNKKKKNPKSSDGCSNEEGELHIFQCVSHQAQQVVFDILNWKSQTTSTTGKDHQRHSGAAMIKSGEELVGAKIKKTAYNDNQSSTTLATTTTTTTSSLSSSSSLNKTTSDQINATKDSPSPVAANGSSGGSGGGKPVVTVASCASSSGSVPIANVNVKETVQVFNQIAALREKSKPASPINHARPLSDASAASSQPAPAAESSSAAPAGTTTIAANGIPDTSRVSASPSGQLYKQRSIRATLAPKYATGSAGASPANERMVSNKLESQNSLSASSSSATSSSEPKSNAAANYQSNTTHNQQLAFPDRHPAGNSYHSKQAEQMSAKDGSSRNHQHHHHHNHQQHPQQLSTAAQSNINHQHPPPPHPHPHQHHHHHSKGSKTQSTRTQQQRSQTESLRSSSSSQSQLDQVTTNESYVSVLNHCFDDIEKFIIRLQQAMAAARELQVKRKLSKRSSQTNGGSGGVNPALPATPASTKNQLTAAELAMLTARARGPSEDDYFEILSKFKLAFNLLAKLKGCIHEPNAPELVHFLFTPLAIIIESARNASPPIDPTLVGIPYLNQDALDLLSNCCTSKESDMWLSLGLNWTQTIDMNLLRASRLPDSFQPIFSDGWAPIIGELELIGLVAPSTASAVGSSVNPASLVGDMSAPARHHHQPNGTRHHPVSSYLSDESLAAATGSADYSTLIEQQPGYSNGSMNNGHLDREKSRPTSARDAKGRNAPSSFQAATSRHNNHDTVDLASRQPYLSTVPFGFAHESSHARPEKSAGLRHQHYSSMPPDYDPNYNAMSLQPQQDIDSQLDVDLAGHHYDHGELQHGGQRINGHNHLRSAPGSSNLHQHRKERAHKQARDGKKNSSHQLHNHQQAAMLQPHPPHPSNLQSMDIDFLDEVEVDQQAMLLDLGLAQTEWYFELQARGAMIVRVLFTRDANNDKELSVRRGELLEVLDDTRKWWRARNIDLQVAHVPHTIVAVMHGYKTLDELLAENPADSEASLMANQRISRRLMQPVDAYDQHWSQGDADQGRRRNSKNAGAFRYF